MMERWEEGRLGLARLPLTFIGLGFKRLHVHVHDVFEARHDI
jgi:hypothetical protein